MNKVWLALMACVLIASGAWCQSIAEVKASSEWMEVCVTGSVTYLQPDECYIEAFDRCGGIWVQGLTDGLAVGDSVIAFGTFAVVDGEPCVTDASIYLRGAPTTIRPFGMPNRAIGGASSFSPLWIWDYCSRMVGSTRTYEWKHAIGLNNTGLLVRTWGTVKATCDSPATRTRWFYIDDGSGLVSDLGNTGLLVYSDFPVNVGEFVSVTGVSSVEPSLDDSARLIRALRTRSADDVCVLTTVPEIVPEYPVADEFDGPSWNPLWIYGSGATGEMSLSENPGWLTITAPAILNVSGTRESAVQPVRLSQYLTARKWDMEMKVRVEGVNDFLIPRQVFRVNFANTWDIYGNKTRSTDTYVGMVAVFCHGPTSEVGVMGQSLGSMAGDTFYFRFRRRNNSIYRSVSTDGVTYSSEYISDGTGVEGLMTLFAYSKSYRMPSAFPPFKVYIDYIRFSRVPIGG